MFPNQPKSGSETFRCSPLQTFSPRLNPLKQVTDRTEVWIIMAYKAIYQSFFKLKYE